MIKPTWCAANARTGSRCSVRLDRPESAARIEPRRSDDADARCAHAASRPRPRRPLSSPPPHPPMPASTACESRPQGTRTSTSRSMVRPSPPERIDRRKRKRGMGEEARGRLTVARSRNAPHRRRLPPFRLRRFIAPLLHPPNSSIRSSRRGMAGWPAEDRARGTSRSA